MQTITKDRSRGRRAYPGEDKGRSVREAVELTKSELANVATFMRIAINQRSAPKTEVVKSGQEHHRFAMSFPLVIKPFRGPKFIVVHDQKKAERVTKLLKRIGYQVQEYLQGYNFIDVKIEGGLVTGEHPRHVRGAVSRMVTYFVMQGVLDFTLKVATNKVRTCIVGACLN